MVKCPRCGYENSSDTVYCNNCAYRLSDADGKRISYTKRQKSWKMGLGKKIVIVLGIIVIAFLLFSFVYNNSQPTKDESLNVISDDGSIPKSSSYPYTAVIKYEGSWSAQMGNPNYLETKTDYGTKSYVLDCASWDRVAIDAQKDDYGEGELKIELLRNGKVIAENSTNSTYGSVIINYNY